MTVGKRKIETAPAKIRVSNILSALDEAAEKQRATLSQIVDAVRAEWIESLGTQKNVQPQKSLVPVTKKELVGVCKEAEIALPISDQLLSQAAQKIEINITKWQERGFQSKARFHLAPGSIENPQQQKNKELFFKLFGKKYEGLETEIIEILGGYDISIRPIQFSSAIFHSEAIENFLPEIGQKFERDPFGVQRKKHLILDKNHDKLVYLATRKKDHGTYLAILRSVAYCSAGCSKCYRGHQTREMKKFTSIDEYGTEQDIYFLSPKEQVEKLVNRWNMEKNPPEDILLSGGEPMDISIEEWAAIFETLKSAKHLKFLRICTGDLFLGEPFRISDPKFLNLLKKWYEQTGKPIKFATNLPHPAFITPESV